MSRGMDSSPKCSIRCPRCGYDQRGVVATWTETCPFEGTCSECGLTLNWSEVLNPQRHEPQWCVEFVSPRTRVPQTCVKTLLYSWWPWKFWSAVKMSHSIRAGRLALYGTCMIVSI